MDGLGQPDQRAACASGPGLIRTGGADLGAARAAFELRAHRIGLRVDPAEIEAAAAPRGGAAAGALEGGHGPGAQAELGPQ